MEDHKPATIVFDKDAGSEIRTATGLATFGPALRCFNTMDPRNIAPNDDEGLFHRNREIIESVPKLDVVLSDGVPAHMTGWADRRRNVDDIARSKPELLHCGEITSGERRVVGIVGLLDEVDVG